MIKGYGIILADDHALMREGIKNLINATKGLQVIGKPVMEWNSSN